jgi:hypothetical protein
MDDSTRLDIARRQIVSARQYTESLLADLDPGCWFTQPAGATTHVAWQVGHLAMAQYGLVLFRQRGRQSADSDLMSSRFRKTFSKGSQPDPTADTNPSPDEIQRVFQQVNEQALEELNAYPLDQLDDPVDEPYAAYATKYGALLFCAHHEMLHAGQIGLLRRLLGNSPIR